jgi:hypothetical protein
MSVMYVVCVSVILFEDFNTLLSRYVAPPLVAAQPHDSATSLVRAVAAQVVGQEVKTLSGILTAGGRWGHLLVNDLSISHIALARLLLERRQREREKLRM